ncbi:MAG: cytochrome c oxidase subunit II [Bacteroidetes bacterium]|nr:cytochrome c oxidase subunit II [Bacteroidota bacterium]
MKQHFIHNNQNGIDLHCFLGGMHKHASKNHFMKKSILLRIFSLFLTVFLLSNLALASTEHAVKEENSDQQSEQIQSENWAKAPNPQNLEEKKISRYAINKQLEQGQANSSQSLTGYIVIIAILVLLIFGGIGAVMKDVQKMTGQKDTTNYNKINGGLMLGFLVLMLVGVFYEIVIHGKYVRLDSSSEHGQAIDNMLIVTLLITGFVFLITQIVLFIFAYKYQYNEKRKALYYPENDKLEILWTVVPAIVLTALVLFGFRTWNNTMIYHENRGKDYTAEAYPYQVELFAYQFGWNFRYPGPDGILGKYDYRLIDPATNPMGIDFSDPASKDDIVTRDLKMPKMELSRFVMRSRDVLHAAHFPDFNAQIYCIPNTQTEFHIKPLYTTTEKRAMENNADYNFELACNQICGASHFNMRQTVEVLDVDEFNKWASSQKAAFNGTEEVDDTQLSMTE